MSRNFTSAVALIVILSFAACASLALTAAVSVSPSVGPPSTSATASGSGFTAGETVNLVFDVSAASSATADASGTFTKTVLIPRNAQPVPTPSKPRAKAAGLARPLPSWCAPTGHRSRTASPASE
jgi:hypothetical protein